MAPNRSSRAAMLLVLAALALIGMACGLFTPDAVVVNPAETTAAESNQPDNSMLAPPAAGNADMLLPDPSAGLATLQNYQVRYDITVTGSLDGEPYQRRTHLERSLVVTATGAENEEIILEIRSTGDPDYTFHSRILDGALYRQDAEDGPCLGKPLDAQQARLANPASRLLPIVQAENLGGETVNGIETTHYHFTQAGLHLAEQNVQVSGDVWVADEGGFVVRYNLSAAAPDRLSGKGLEAGQEIVYELTRMNENAPISLPSGCAPVLLDMPVMPDAQNLLRGSGVLTYTSPATVAEITDYYNQRLAETGWGLDGTAIARDETSPTTLFYHREDENLTILLESASANQEVSVMHSRQGQEDEQAGPDLTPDPIAEPASPIDFAQSGLPADVQLYPKADGLQNLAGMGAMFTSADSPEQVALFYRNSLTDSGWVIQNEMISAETIVLLWQKEQQMLNVVISLEEGKTKVVITTNAR